MDFFSFTLAEIQKKQYSEKTVSKFEFIVPEHQFVISSKLSARKRENLEIDFCNYFNFVKSSGNSIIQFTKVDEIRSDYLEIIFRMPEHSPCPTPARGIYGYVLFLCSCFGLFVYFFWAFIPDPWLHAVGFTYYPHKYWAVAVPIYSICGLFFFQIFICAYNLANLCDFTEHVKIIDDDFGAKDN